MKPHPASSNASEVVEPAAEPAVVLQHERRDIGLWLVAFAVGLVIQCIVMAMPGLLLLANGVRP